MEATLQNPALVAAKITPKARTIAYRTLMETRCDGTRD